ncbi:MAG TPA: ERF family protein, partial [Bacillota bacterium]|nr:ERF family protein [Bacillota bacterium]
MAEKNILTLLNEIQEELRVPKGQWNDFGGFHYRSAEDILEAVKPLLYKRDMTLVMTDDAVMMGERHYIKATVTIYHGDQRISVSAYAREAESRPKMDVAQLTGSASSYARKYALNGLLLIDDIKDADTNEYNKQGNGKPKAKAKPVDDDRLPWDMDEDEGE